MIAGRLSIFRIFGWAHMSLSLSLTRLFVFLLRCSPHSRVSVPSPFDGECLSGYSPVTPMVLRFCVARKSFRPQVLLGSAGSRLLDRHRPRHLGGRDTDGVAWGRIFVREWGRASCMHTLQSGLVPTACPPYTAPGASWSSLPEAVAS